MKTFLQFKSKPAIVFALCYLIYGLILIRSILVFDNEANWLVINLMYWPVSEITESIWKLTIYCIFPSLASTRFPDYFTLITFITLGPIWCYFIVKIIHFLARPKP